MKMQLRQKANLIAFSSGYGDRLAGRGSQIFLLRRGEMVLE
jgi:hypothetical protein